MKKIVAFGNPLLDTTVFIENNSLLEKYNLKSDDEKEIIETDMKRLSEDISGYRQFNSAGGCAQNSLRILQWLTGKRCDANVFGSVGKDKEATLLRQLLENDGVHTRYIEQENLPTGKTIALVKPPYRSLVAYLGAAEKLPINDLLLENDCFNLVLESDFVFIEGFFLTNRTDTAKYVLDYCNTHSKIVIFNICGEYICNICPNMVQYFVENSDITFGNKREYEAVAKIMNMNNIGELINHLINRAKNTTNAYSNIIIVTDGANPGFCVYERGKVKNFIIPKIDINEIRDTTGAGDAFTGGFIAGLCINKSVEECAKIGCYAAYHIIQQIGVTLPNFSPNILSETVKI